MLDGIRSNAHSFWVKLAFGIIILVFVFWGIGARQSPSGIVASVNGEFVVKRLFKTRTRTELRPDNKKFDPIEIGEEDDFRVWGVVRTVLHNV